MGKQASEHSKELLGLLYDHGGRDYEQLRRLINSQPADVFKKLNLSGPDYEIKGKSYNALKNMKSNWMGEGVLEQKVEQYVLPKLARPAVAAPTSNEGTAPVTSGAPAAVAAGDDAAGRPNVPPVQLTPDHRPGGNNSQLGSGPLLDMFRQSLRVVGEEMAECTRQHRLQMAESDRRYDQRHAQLQEHLAQSERLNDQRHAQLQEEVARSERRNDKRHEQIQDQMANGFAQLSTEQGAFKAHTELRFNSQGARIERIEEIVSNLDLEGKFKSTPVRKSERNSARRNRK